MYKILKEKKFRSENNALCNFDEAFFLMNIGKKPKEKKIEVIPINLPIEEKDQNMKKDAVFIETQKILEAQENKKIPIQNMIAVNKVCNLYNNTLEVNEIIYINSSLLEDPKKEGKIKNGTIQIIPKEKNLYDNDERTKKELPLVYMLPEKIWDEIILRKIKEEKNAMNKALNQNVTVRVESNNTITINGNKSDVYYCDYQMFGNTLSVISVFDVNGILNIKDIATEKINIFGCNITSMMLYPKIKYLSLNDTILQEKEIKRYKELKELHLFSDNAEEVSYNGIENLEILGITQPKTKRKELRLENITNIKKIVIAGEIIFLEKNISCEEIIIDYGKSSNNILGSIIIKEPIKARKVVLKSSGCIKEKNDYNEINIDWKEDKKSVEEDNDIFKLESKNELKLYGDVGGIDTQPLVFNLRNSKKSLILLFGENNDNEKPKNIEINTDAEKITIFVSDEQYKLIEMMDIMKGKKIEEEEKIKDYLIKNNIKIKTLKEAKIRYAIAKGQQWWSVG